MKAWITKDKTGNVDLWFDKPEEKNGVFSHRNPFNNFHYDSVELPMDSVLELDITFEKSPVEVDINVTGGVK